MVVGGESEGFEDITVIVVQVRVSEWVGLLRQFTKV